MNKNYESGTKSSSIVMLEKSEPLFGDEIYIFILVPDDAEAPIQRRALDLHSYRRTFEQSCDALRHDTYAEFPVDHFLDEIPLGSFRYDVRHETGIFTCGSDDLIQVEILIEHDETFMFQLFQVDRVF